MPIAWYCTGSSARSSRSASTKARAARALVSRHIATVRSKPSLAATRWRSPCSPRSSSSSWARRSGRPVEARALEEEELEQELGAEIAHVHHGPAEPAPERRASARRRREQNAFRPARARRAAAILDVAEVAQDGDGAVDERPAHRPHVPDRAVRREGTRDVPAVRASLPQQAEHGPLGQRRLGASLARHRPILRPARLSRRRPSRA